MAVAITAAHKTWAKLVVASRSLLPDVKTNLNNIIDNAADLDTLITKVPFLMTYANAPGASMSNTVADNLKTVATTLGLTIPSVVSLLVDDGVTSDLIADSAVQTNHISDSAVGTQQLAVGAVKTAVISDSEVTTAKLAVGAVKTAVISDSEVTTAKLAVGAVKTAVISDSEV
ncbi:MAG: hypothetical protein AABY27_01290, partial [Pseudomonadota bacterium]